MDKIDLEDTLIKNIHANIASNKYDKTRFGYYLHMHHVKFDEYRKCVVSPIWLRTCPSLTQCDKCMVLYHLFVSILYPKKFTPLKWNIFYKLHPHDIHKFNHHFRAHAQSKNILHFINKSIQIPLKTIILSFFKKWVLHPMKTFLGDGGGSI